MASGLMLSMAKDVGNTCGWPVMTGRITGKAFRTHVPMRLLMSDSNADILADGYSLMD